MLTDLPSQLIPTADIHPDPSQPRRSFDLTQLETLKADLKAQGLLQPILVRRDAGRKQFVIVCGERRWRCARELAWSEISARVIDRELSPAEIVTLQLMENLQRENLNPMDEARSLARLQELLQCSREELAGQVHRSTASICRSFKLLELPVEVQAFVELGQLPVSIAATLQACADPALQRELAVNYVAGGMIRDDVQEAVRHARAAKSPARPKAWTLALGSGITLRIAAATPLKECEAAVANWLRQLRAAKAATTDLETFAASWTAEHVSAR